MAKKRPQSPTEQNPSFEWLKRRQEVDEALGTLIEEFGDKLKSENPYRLLEFAGRCARRVCDLKIAPVEAEWPDWTQRLVRFGTDLTNFASWAACEAATDAGRERRSELYKHAQDGEAAYGGLELSFYLADQKSLAILEMGRVGARILEAIQDFYEGDDRRIYRKVASAAAHAILMVECSGNRDNADELRRIAMSEIRNFPREGRSFPALETAGQNLSSGGDHANESAVAKIKNHKSVDEIKRMAESLEGLAIPRTIPEIEELIGDSGVLKDLRKTEDILNDRQREQIADLQRLLDRLKGKSFGQPANNRLAAFITNLAMKACAHLTISGEFENSKGQISVYTLEPVLLRSDHKTVASFTLRRGGSSSTPITTSKLFPQLYAIPRHWIDGQAKYFEPKE